MKYWRVLNPNFNIKIGDINYTNNDSIGMNRYMFLTPSHAILGRDFELDLLNPELDLTNEGTSTDLMLRIANYNFGTQNPGVTSQNEKNQFKNHLGVWFNYGVTIINEN